MRLMLAEGPGEMEAIPTTNPNPYGPVINPYIRIPAPMTPTGKVMYIREDYFDWMNPEEFANFMAHVLSFDEATDQTMSGLFSSVGDAINTVVENRQYRKNLRTESRQARRGERVAYRGEARLIRAGEGGGFWGTAQQGIQTYGDVAGTAIETLGPAALQMYAQSQGLPAGGMFGGMQPGGGTGMLGGINPIWFLVGAAGVIGIILLTRRN